MKQCETCLYREYKDYLICCNANHLHFAFREMLKSLPLIGKDIHDYECKAYEMDRFLEIKEKMKNKDFKKAIYQGFNSHEMNMETVKEKLITLLQAADEYAFGNCAEHGSCDECDKLNKGCVHEIKAHHLIQNGVTLIPETGIGEMSDGYHTFNELYHHRALLFATICNMHPDKAWKAKKHDDGSMYDGMFIVGIETESGQATYHYDIEPYWDMFHVRELEKAPVWDGHTPEEALQRITTLQDSDKWVSVDDPPKESGHYWVNIHQKDEEKGEECDFVLDAWYQPNDLLFAPKEVGWTLMNEWHDLTGQMRQYITHWMQVPYPQPPKGVQ